ncbi:unnamed protein product [Paramecium octaurelia]|uniref:Protein kinase domain-containing protein n=1 Tax=Paramecium octaurelia TaxID=43137 RepID=A0A8S1UEI9_PAROT|nr:unnamed protein product [Paramecium octaurelia]
MIKFFCNQIIKSQTKDYLDRQFVIVKELASDTNGAIYEAKGQSSSYRSNVALKISYNMKEQEEKYVDWLIQQQANNTQLIKFYEKIEQKQYKLTIMELGVCNLYEYLKANKKSNSDKFKIFIQTLKAIKYLNENDYICEDIKTKNYVQVQNTFKLTGSGYKKRLQLMNQQFSNNQSQKIYDFGPLIYLFFEIYLGEQFFQVQNASEINGIKYDWMSKLPLNQRQDITELIRQLLKDPDGLSYEQAYQKYTNLKSFFTEKNEFKSQVEPRQSQQLPNGNYTKSSVIQVLDVPTNEFPKRKFILTHQLGVGGEGVVFKATPINQTAYQTDVAVKIQNSIKNNELNFIQDLIRYQRNVEPQSIKKSNLIKLHELYQLNNKLLIVMELGGKNLYNYLTDKKSSTDNEKLQICQQITQGIAFLHEKEIFHRDIKPENFIQCGNIFKLIDFGLIKNNGQNTRLTKMVGTPLYQAPEVITGSDDYSSSVDIWSLGCLFYEIFKYEPLFNCTTIDQVKKAIELHCKNQDSLNNQIDQLQIKQELKNLIKEMVHPIPHMRPTIITVLKQIQPPVPITQSIIPKNPTLEQFQPQKAKGLEEIKLQSAIKDYLISLMKKSNHSIGGLIAKDQEEMIQTISNQTITNLNKELENQLKTKQINFSKKLATKIQMIPPEHYQNKTVDDDQPNFDSEIQGNHSKIQPNILGNNKQNKIMQNGLEKSVINPQPKY